MEIAQVIASVQGMSAIAAALMFGFAAVAKGLSVEVMSKHQIMIQGIFLSFAIPYSVNTVMAVIARDRGVHIPVLFILLPGLVVSVLGVLGHMYWLHFVDRGLALSLVALSCLFQCINGVQTVFVGAIRGVQDVKYPPVVAFFSYWVVALPLSLVLSHYYGLHGIWCAMIVGQCLQLAAFSGRWVFLRRRIRIVST